MGVGVLDVLRLAVMEQCLLAQTHTLCLVLTLPLEPATDAYALIWAATRENLFSGFATK